MRTTALVVEILVTGILTLFGFVLIVTGLYPVEAKEYVTYLNEHDGLVVPLMSVGFSTAYLIGWLVNILSYPVSCVTYARGIRSKVSKKLDGKEWIRIREAVYKSGSDASIGKIGERMSAVRVTRAAVLLSIVYAFACLVLNKYTMMVFFIVFFVICIIAARVTYQSYVERMYGAFVAIENQSQLN